MLLQSRIFKRFFGPTLETQEETMRETNVAVINTDTNGYTLCNAYGDAIQTYTRRRDAVRGAQRRGLQLA